MSLKVYLDCSPLTNAQVSGIGVYNKNLFIELKKKLNDDLFPVLKWSRLSKKATVKNHIGQDVLALAPLLLNKDIMYHGTDHKLNTYSRGPRIVTVHDMQPFLGKWLDPLFASQRIKLMTNVFNSDVDRIIAVSHFTKNEIIKYFPHVADKIDVIYHGYDFCKKPIDIIQPPINRIEKITNGRPFLFFIGNLEERKNLINQIKAFEILKEKNNDLIFILSGREGFNFKSIQSFISGSRYRNDIYLTSYLSEFEKDYAFKHTSCFMFASWYEGFGIPVIEALSQNTNILISAAGSLGEIGNGYCHQCDPANPGHIASQVEIIMEHGNIKKIDLEVWKKDWSWEKCALGTIAVYEKSL